VDDSFSEAGWRRSGPSSTYLHVLAAALAFIHLGIGLSFSTVDPPDTPSYVNFARTLGSQLTFADNPQLDLFRTPGYPVFMRAVWSIFGEQRTALLAVQWLLLVGLALTVAHFVNTRLLIDRSVSLYPGAVLLFLLDPLLTFGAYSQLSELLFACLIFAAVFTFFGAAMDPAPRSAALSGVWLGLASLTRPVSVFLPIFLGPLLIIMATPKRRALRMALIFVGVSCAFPAFWVARNLAVAGIPAVATVGVFNLAHFRAVGVLAEAEGVSFEQADAAISARTGRTIETAADYTRTRAVATEILRAHPFLLVKQMVRSSLFQLLDPGSIYIAQIMGASPRGSGVLAAFATQGPSALLRYFETMAVVPSVLFVYSLLFAGLVYVTLLAGIWIAVSRNPAMASWIKVANFRPWLILIGLVSIYLVGIQAGPEAAGRFRMALLPLWHSVVLATWSSVLNSKLRPPAH
jgi:hypothetical protein